MPTLLTALLLAVLATSATHTYADELECHQSAQFLVVAAATGEIGSNFLVKPKVANDSAPNCDYLAQPQDFEIRNENAEYFLALQHQLLLLDSGTGAEQRELIIWDLSQRKIVFRGDYAEPLQLTADSAVYWQEQRDTEASADNCPQWQQLQAEGMAAAIEQQVALDLASFNLRKLNPSRCEPRQ